MRCQELVSSLMGAFVRRVLTRIRLVRGNCLKQQWLSLVQEEAVTRKHASREGGGRLITPGFGIATGHPVILQATKIGMQQLSGGSAKYA